MGTLIRNCPHCQATNSTYTTFAEYQVPHTQSPVVYLAALQCGSCHEGYFAKFRLESGTSPHSYLGNLENSRGLILTGEYPKAVTTEAPKHLPGNIEKFFIQAVNSLRTGSCDASAMMSRKVLEVAVKKLNPKGSGNLYKRIEQLHQQGMITDDLKNWAHIIRDDGNTAAHEEKPVTQKFADELLSFAELFLMYTFTMPGMVKEKKTSDAENE